MDTIDKHFRELTKAAFARHGFGQGELAAHWPEIVGEDLARLCEPERIAWPRPGGETSRTQGGTLTLRAAPGRALELRHEAPRLLDRINRYFGYGAIAALKITQAAALRPVPAGPAPRLPNVPAPDLEGFSEEPLRLALERLGQAVARTRPVSPQGK